jgi:hypothetical protein
MTGAAASSVVILAFFGRRASQLLHDATDEPHHRCSGRGGTKDP